MIKVTFGDILQRSNWELNIDDINDILNINARDNKYKLCDILEITREQYEALGMPIISNYD